MTTNVTDIPLDSAKKCVNYMKKHGQLSDWPICAPSTVPKDTLIQRKIHKYIKEYFKLYYKGKFKWEKNNLYAMMILALYNKNNGDLNKVNRWKDLLEKKVIIEFICESKDCLISMCCCSQTITNIYTITVVVPDVNSVYSLLAGCECIKKNNIYYQKKKIDDLKDRLNDNIDETKKEDIKKEISDLEKNIDLNSKIMNGWGVCHICNELMVRPSVEKENKQNRDSGFGAPQIWPCDECQRKEKENRKIKKIINEQKRRSDWPISSTKLVENERLEILNITMNHQYKNYQVRVRCISYNNKVYTVSFKKKHNYIIERLRISMKVVVSDKFTDKRAGKFNIEN